MGYDVRYFDGISAKAQTLFANVDGNFLLLKTETGSDVGRWNLDQLRDENSPPIPQQLNLSTERESAARIQIEDKAFVQQLTEACPTLRKRRPQAAGWWRPYVFVGGGAVLSVAVFFMIGLPLLATAIANIIPIETREKIGATVENQIIRSFSKNKEEEAVCHSKAGQVAIERLIEQFRESSDVEMPPIVVTVIKSKHANAFALPGGRMVILSSLIDKAGSPNAIAGIIGHEFGHIEAKHPTSLFVANIGTAAILSLVFGDVTGGTLLAGIGQMALGAAYSRDFERFADTRAIDLMTHWNYDISPSISLLQNLVGDKGKSNGVFAFFSTHPDITERVEQLKSAGKTGVEEAFTTEDWQAIKTMCSNSI